MSRDTSLPPPSPVAAWAAPPRSRRQRADRTSTLLRQAREADPLRRAALLDEIIVLNRGVARSVAARYRGRGVDQEDLEQVAFEGLTKAVRRFDLDSDNDLLTYAVPTIRGELQRYFRDLGWAVRPPRRIQELQRSITLATHDLRQDLGHDPEPAEVARRLGITLAEHDAALAAQGCFHPTSLDLPVSPDSELALVDLIPDATAGTAIAEARAVLGPVVRRLPERDRTILYLRFFEDLTQAEIGERIGVTQMQVSRLLTRILGGLRAELEGGVAAAS